jgi:hypothetical protein
LLDRRNVGAHRLQDGELGAPLLQRLRHFVARERAGSRPHRRPPLTRAVWRGSGTARRPRRGCWARGSRAWRSSWETIISRELAPRRRVRLRRSGEIDEQGDEHEQRVAAQSNQTERERRRLADRGSDPGAAGITQAVSEERAQHAPAVQQEQQVMCRGVTVRLTVPMVMTGPCGGSPLDPSERDRFLSMIWAPVAGAAFELRFARSTQQLVNALGELRSSALNSAVLIISRSGRSRSASQLPR